MRLFPDYDAALAAMARSMVDTIAENNRAAASPP